MRRFFWVLLVFLGAASAYPEGGIQWYATWQQGLAQARRTGRPILLVAAAPHCHNVPGIW
jgi:hypothetical protein